MCDVDEDGVEGKPQGGHESTHADATDGIQTPASHNWPNQPKFSGGGVAEPVEGTRWSDGGTLTGGSGQDELTYKKGGSGMPKKGPIKGTKGPQNGQPSESWSPELVGSLLGEDRNLQSLFNSYARAQSIVCLEDFQTLCNAHGIDVRLDEASILKLMRDNQEYIFYEGVDANGPYWTPTPFAAKNGIQEGRQRPFDGTIGEMQIRSPQEEAVLGNMPDREEDAEFGEFADMNDMGPEGHEGDPDEDPEYDEDESNGPGPYGMHNAPYDECPECGFLGDGSEECPECGASMGGGMDENDLVGDRQLGASIQDVDDADEWEAQGYGDEGEEAWDSEWAAEGGEESVPVGGMDDMMGGMDEMMSGMDEVGGMGDMGDMGDMDDFGSDSSMDDEVLGSTGAPPGDWPKSYHRTEKATRPGSNMSREKLFDPDVQESLKRFMVSARNIIEQNSDADRRAVGEALTQSWRHYVAGFDARQAPSKVQQSLHELAKRFPRFNPLTECDAMDKLGGTVIGTSGGGPKDAKFLAPNDQPGMKDMKELGEPLGKKQKNNLEGTPTIKGTGKGLEENVQRISKYVRKHLQESAASLRGKFNVTFTCLVQEGSQINRTNKRVRLAEAVADVEELLQFHHNDKVVLEASFNDGRKVVLTHRIPMLQVVRRRPIMSEDSALFRFTRHAEQYAEHLMGEGYSCKLLEHNWGAAVKVLTEKKKKNAKKACK